MTRKLAANHSHPIVHPARLRQLAHTRIHERVAGQSSLPRLETVGVVPPLDEVERRVQRSPRHRRLLPHVMRVPVVPGELTNDGRACSIAGWVAVP